MIVSAIAFIAWTPFSQIVVAFMQQVDAALTDLSGPNPVLRWGGGFVFTVLVWAICVALLWLEVRRPRPKTIVVQRVSGGQAELTADSIVSRLEYNIDQLPDVIRARPHVRTARKGVRVELAVETSPEVEVPSKSEEIQEVTRDIIENQMGLKLESMRVVMRHAPYPKSFFKGHKPETGMIPQPAIRPQAPQPPRIARPTTPATVTPEPVEPPPAAPARYTAPVASAERPLVSAVSSPAAAATALPEPAPEVAAVAPPAAERPPWRPWSFLRSNATAEADAGTTSDNGAPTEDVVAPAVESMVRDTTADDTLSSGSTDDEGKRKDLFS
jgi:hypothetical protein